MADAGRQSQARLAADAGMGLDAGHPHAGRVLSLAIYAYLSGH